MRKRRLSFIWLLSTLLLLGEVAALAEVAQNNTNDTIEESSFLSPCHHSIIDSNVRIVGRYHCDVENSKILMGWSGTGFIAQVANATGLQFVQDGPSIEYTIVVDGHLEEKLVTIEGNNVTYVVASGLATSKDHKIEVYRRTEARIGTIAISKIAAINEGYDEDALLVPPPKSNNRSIEIFGDSITCGFGNEGRRPTCPFSINTQNHYMTYAAILARRFDADLSTVAWSGKGVVANYHGDNGPKLPEMIQLATPSSVGQDFNMQPYLMSASRWNTTLASKEPDLAIVNLGTNDFSGRFPPIEEFTSGYVDLLLNIRSMYPRTFVLTTIGPLLDYEKLSTVEAMILVAIEDFKTVSRNDSNATINHHTFTTTNLLPPGCQWHPSIITHQAMAEELAAVVETFLGW